MEIQKEGSVFRFEGEKASRDWRVGKGLRSLEKREKSSEIVENGTNNKSLSFLQSTTPTMKFE